MGPFELAMIATAAFAGATTQRVSGLGFALTATPFFTLVAGASTGVSIGNSLAVLTALFVLSRTWRAVSWGRAGWLLLFAIAGAVVGGASAGFLAGAINVTAGVGGPVYALHAAADRWPTMVDRHLLGRRIPAEWSRPIVLGISAIGGLTALVHGLLLPH